MFNALTDVVVGIFEFIVDIVLFRRQRRKRDHSERAFSEDAGEIARFDIVTLTCIGLASAALMFFLNFVVGVSVGWSVGVGVAVGGVWGVWRYMQMVNSQ